MLINKFQKFHFFFTVWTDLWIITEGREDCSSPFGKAAVNVPFVSGYGKTKFGIDAAMSGIKPAIVYHFKMFFRDMPNQPFDKVNGRNRLFDIFLILMAVVVESYGFAVIMINPGSSNDRTTKIAPNIFDNCFGVADVRFCINIKSLSVFGITSGFHFFERRPDFVFQFVQKSSSECIAKKGVIKIFYMPPESIIAVAAFGKETVDMRVPLEITAKRMEDHDKTGSEVFGFVHLIEHA